MIRIIGIDIGSLNFAITVYTCPEHECNHYHFNISKSLLNIQQTIELIIQHLNINNNDIIKIEKQLNRNTKCIVLQNILETLLYTKNIKYMLINPSKKYTNIVSIYGKVVKKDLIKQVYIDKNKCQFYNILSDIIINTNKNIKMDDIVDSKLICIVLHTCYDKGN